MGSRIAQETFMHVCEGLSELGSLRWEDNPLPNVGSPILKDWVLPFVTGPSASDGRCP